jgi:hypothetical protein
MPYETVIDAVQILRATLDLLEHTEFPEKNSATIRTVVEHLNAAIADLEIARKKLEVKSAAPPSSQDASRIKDHR